MTEEEYLHKKTTLDKQYDELSSLMDVMGYSKYQDGTGDYGTRRLFVKGALVSTIRILDMVPVFNDYPDGQFLNVEKDCWINGKDDLYSAAMNFNDK